MSHIDVPTPYERRRSEVETYFDRTAAETWRRLTSDAPVSGVRATVRAGRDRMRETLLSWLPQDLSGRRILDAGCGTGAMALELAARGGEVVAIDLSATLVGIARERAEAAGVSSIDFRVGDLVSPQLGRFDHIVSMDVLIHYREEQVVAMLGDLAARADASVLFTIAPRTPLLTAMHAVGKFFPRGDRAPGIQPLGLKRLAGLVAHADGLRGWRLGRSVQVTSGFYLSCAQELVKA